MERIEYSNHKLYTVFKKSNFKFKEFKPCIKPKCCQECTNRCCDDTPCALAPEEFLHIDDLDYMKNVLNLGALAIAPLTFRQDVFCIRARGQLDLDTISTGFVLKPNSCILQTSRGCILDPITRPTEGLLLIPDRGEASLTTCRKYYSFNSMIEDWKKYQKIVKELKKYYDNIEIEKPYPTEGLANDYTYRLLGQ